MKVGSLRVTDLPSVKACSIVPNEILPSTARIQIDLSSKAPIEALRTAATVPGVDGKVSISNGGGTLIWSASGLTTGAYEFVVDDISGPRGKAIASGGRIPFRVIACEAAPPASVRIEHHARIRLEGDAAVRVAPGRDDGPRFDVFKGTDRKRGTPVEVAYDETGTRVDLRKIQSALRKERIKRYGKLHPQLVDYLAERPGNDPTHVAVWFRSGEFDDPGERPDRLTKTAERKLEAQAKALAEFTRERAGLVEEYGGEITAVSTVAPVVRAHLSREGIEELARRDDVAGVFLYDPEGIDDLENSLPIHRSNQVIAGGTTAKDVKVAVWESHPASTTDLDIEDQYLSSGFATSAHAQNVSGIIKNTEDGEPHGHAPDCLLHSANSTAIEALDWAVGEARCRVVNQSFHRTAEATGGGFSFDDIYKDWLALRYPYPVFVHAAGNYFATNSEVNPPQNEFVNHKGYNALSVGNHDDDAEDMNTSGGVFSVFRNPTSPHGDRELPEVAANGSLVTAAGTTFTGTSQAAPAVAGIVAQLHETHSSLPTWPEACRAIIMAGARRNVVGSTWWEDVRGGVDASDGSGSVNATESNRIAGTRRAKNSSAAQRGWNAGYLTDADFDPTSRYANFEYKVKVPNKWFGPTHVKVALTWTSTIDTDDDGPVDSTLGNDLDLYIVDSSGTIVAYSVSWDNSYEIAEFAGERGEEYTIRIRRFSGDSPTYHGIAWTVTGGIWDLIRLGELTALELARVDLVSVFG